MTKIDNMLVLAVKSHYGQYRKGSPLMNGTQMPYIIHPMAVFDLVMRWGISDEDVLATCLGHDLLEDTDVARETIVTAAGQTVLDWIEQLSFFSPVSDPIVYAKQKADYIAEFATATKPIEVLVVKFADRIKNTMDFMDANLTYARKYWDKASPIFSAVNTRSQEIEDRFGKIVLNNILRAQLEMNSAIRREYYYYA